jgi:hypothetical protein
MSSPNLRFLTRSSCPRRPPRRCRPVGFESRRRATSGRPSIARPTRPTGRRTASTHFLRSPSRPSFPRAPAARALRSAWRPAGEKRWRTRPHVVGRRRGAPAAELMARRWVLGGRYGGATGALGGRYGGATGALRGRYGGATGALRGRYGGATGGPRGGRGGGVAAKGRAPQRAARARRREVTDVRPTRPALGRRAVFLRTVLNRFVTGRILPSTRKPLCESTLRFVGLRSSCS